MKDIQDMCFIVQARTQSVRIPNKMLKPFWLCDDYDTAINCNEHCHKQTSLLELTINKVLSSNIPKDNFYLSVLDNELFDLAHKYDVKTFRRSEASTQEPVKLQTVYEWWDKLPYKYYVLISACAPLLKIDTINNFVDTFCKSESRGLLSVFEKKHFIFDKQHKRLNTFLGEHDYLVTFETKLLEPFYETAGALYAGTMEDIGKNIYMGNFTSETDPEFFVMNEEECLDIDYQWQFDLAQELHRFYSQNGDKL